MSFVLYLILIISSIVGIICFYLFLVLNSDEDKMNRLVKAINYKFLSEKSRADEDVYNLAILINRENYMYGTPNLRKEKKYIRKAFRPKFPIFRIDAALVDRVMFKYVPIVAKNDFNILNMLVEYNKELIFELNSRQLELIKKYQNFFLIMPETKNLKAGDIIKGKTPLLAQSYDIIKSLKNNINIINGKSKLYEVKATGTFVKKNNKIICDECSVLREVSVKQFLKEENAFTRFLDFYDLKF